MTVTPSTRHGGQSAWPYAVAGWSHLLIPSGIAAVILAIGFHREGIDAVTVWLSSTAYNHCFLVLPVVGYLLWLRRSVLKASLPRPALWPLLLMVPLTIAWLLAAGLDINEGRQLLVVAMLQVIILSALGAGLYRFLLAPLLFLFFLVPCGYFLVPWLQSVTADIAAAGLRLAHVPVFSDGYLIEIPEGPFEIAEACAGLRFLIAATAFSCFFAVVVFHGWLRRSCFIALSIVVAILANGMRAFGLIYYAHLSGRVAAVMADHILYGWLFFSVVIGLLIAIGMLLPERDRAPARAELTPTLKAGPRWRAVVIPLAAILAVSGPAYAAWRDSLVPLEALPEAASPEVAAPWYRADQVSDWHPIVHGADREFLETFKSAGRDTGVTRYVALYRLRPAASRLTLSYNQVADDKEWRIAPLGRRQIDVAGEKITVNRVKIVRGPHRGLVWWFYAVDGRSVAGLLDAKMLQLRAALRQARPVGALVMIETGLDVGEDAAEQTLIGFLSAGQSVAQYAEQLR